ncbi:MAG: hypothetical protein M3R24_08025 [Chloroflexota bacterium]|nr:hypothetical protein [Chloroflexota bacterium]
MARQFRFAGLVEQLPRPDNRVIPAFDQVDALGIPRPRLIYKLSEDMRQGLAAARDMHNKLFDAIGVTFRQHADDDYGRVI